MGQMTSKDQHISSLKGYGYSALRILPRLRNVPSMRQLDVHLVRPGDDLQTTIFGCRGINGNVSSHVFNATDMIIGRGIEVCLESVSEGSL